MQTPTANDALGVWERGSGQGQAERGLALLGLALPGTPPAALADISVGTRDGALLDLRETMFGSRIDGCANCPRCGELMEMNFSTHDLRAEAPGESSIALRVEDYSLTLRPLTTRDLLALGHGDIETARRGLLSRCLIAADHNGEPATVENLPTPVIDAAAQALAKADPQADIKLSIACAACGHLWQAPFDILSYLWTELEAWAARILREVHILAAAYGWNEGDILALSPARRKFYLDMAAS